jgi:catechol 2,3-dioxygenase
MTKKNAIASKTGIGHVHLKVSHIETSLRFYQDILGFEVTSRYGDQAVFLSAGGYHHHIGLNTWESEGGVPPDSNNTGLYHFAILLPTRKDLAQVLKRLIDAEYPIGGASDHGVSEAIYLNDPDGIGIELYWDRPKKEWIYNDDGTIAMKTAPLDLHSLLEIVTD